MQRSTTLILAVLLPALLHGAPAAAHSVSFDAGAHYVVTPAMEDLTTLGSEMAGMQMTVVQGGVSTLYTWGVLQDDFGGFSRGGVINDKFAIHATGDTWCFSGCRQWWVQTLPFQANITQITFHGSTSGLVFDITTTPDSNFGTPGSGRGITFVVGNQNSPIDNVAAVYRNEVSVGAWPVVGDLYVTLELNFLNGGLEDGHYIQFGADTDRMPGTATLFPAVPEPGRMVLMVMGTALIALMAARRRPVAPARTAPSRFSDPRAAHG